VEHLTKQYVKGVSAVDDISFSLTEGEVFGLLGPMGGQDDDDLDAPRA
jgi:ABC-2 type transport system ATP-binding protein